MHRSIESGVVKGVQRLAEFEHHVIGDVDQRRDGADATALEAPFHPVRRRRPGIDALEDAAEIERTGGRRIEHNSTLIGDGGRNGGNLRQRGRSAGYRRNLTGDTGQRQAVGAVRRQLQREQAVVEVEILADRLPDWSIGRQNQEAGGVFGDPQFLSRTERALASPLVLTPSEQIEEFQVEALTTDGWIDAALPEQTRKKLISLRVDPEVLEFFKAQGPGYQTRMNAVLTAYMQVKKEIGQA